MFGHDSRPSRVYAWNTLPPTTGEAEAIQAMRSRLSLWNKLVEIDRDINARRNALAFAAEPRLPRIEEERTAIALAAAPALAKRPSGAERKAIWRRLMADPVTGPRLKALADERKAAWKRVNADPVITLSFAVLETERRERVKAASAASGLYWCNYDDVVASYRLARSQPGDLQFHSWREARGKVSVRWQTGLPVADLFGDDTRCQVDPVPPEAYTLKSRRARLHASETKIRIRVASDERRKPVWLELPFPMHRPLPEGGIVRQVAAYRERIGTHYRWSITITVELPERLASPTPKGAGTIAIDLGWRKLPEGVRVAAWRDDAGQSDTLVLSESIVKQLLRPEDIQGVRDKDFNAARDGLRRWLESATLSDWLREETKTLAQWHSPARLAALAIRWRNERFADDEAGFALVEDWRRRDKHLYEYQSNERDQALHQRRYLFREFAAWIARTYASIRLEKFDLSEVASDGKKDLHKPARHQRFVVAPSELRLTIESAARREGLVVERVDAAYTTQTCHACGSVEQFDAAKELVHKCSACGEAWDQDDNAAQNLLSQTEGDLEQKSDCDEDSGLEDDLSA